jgi:hypothetical protein
MSEQKLSNTTIGCLREAGLIKTEIEDWFVQGARIINRETNCDTLAAVNSALRGALDYVKNHSTQQDVVFIAEEALSACPPDSMAQ